MRHVGFLNREFRFESGRGIPLREFEPVPNVVGSNLRPIVGEWLPRTIVIELIPTVRVLTLILLVIRNFFLKFYEAQAFSPDSKRRAALGRPSSILGLQKAPIRSYVNGYAFWSQDQLIACPKPPAQPFDVRPGYYAAKCTWGVRVWAQRSSAWHFVHADHLDCCGVNIAHCPTCRLPFEEAALIVS